MKVNLTTRCGDKFIMALLFLIWGDAHGQVYTATKKLFSINKMWITDLIIHPQFNLFI